MARTYRNPAAHTRCHRSGIRVIGKVKQNYRFVEEVMEEGYNPRPRDKALANIHGGSVVTSWDDLPIAGRCEGFNSAQRGFYDGEVFTWSHPSERHSVEVNLINPDENSVMALHISAPKNVLAEDIIAVDRMKFGVKRVVNATNLIVERL